MTAPALDVLRRTVKFAQERCPICLGRGDCLGCADERNALADLDALVQALASEDRHDCPVCHRKWWTFKGTGTYEDPFTAEIKPASERHYDDCLLARVTGEAR